MDHYHDLVNLLTDRLVGDDLEQAVELLDQLVAQKPATPLKLTSDKAAAVNPDTFWIPISQADRPLVGARYLLINQAAGVTQVGPYRDDGWYTHFAGLPKFKD